MQPVEAVIEPKVKQRPGGPARPARSVADWDREEREEPVPKARLQGPEDQIAGSAYKWLNWDDPKWVDPATIDPNTLQPIHYRVSNYYPAVKLIIDYPPSDKYVAAKKAFFASIKVLYIGLPPGSPALDREQVLAELERQAAAFEKEAPRAHAKPAAASPAALPEKAPARAGARPAPARARAASVAKKPQKGRR